MTSTPAPPRRRSLSWPSLIGLLVAFAILPALFDVFVIHREGDQTFPDLESAEVLTASKVIALLVVTLAITWLRWWPPVLREQLRVRRWVWVVPAVFLVMSMALVDYGRLSRAGWALTGLLALGCLVLAVGEELMYRGLVLTFLRQRYREVFAAIGSSLIFGLSHFPAGLLNVVASCFMGYLLYYVRRVSGGLVVPVVVHAAYDFAVYSSLTTATPNLEGDASPALFLATVLMTLAMIALHRVAEPARVPSAGDAAS